MAEHEAPVTDPRGPLLAVAGDAAATANKPDSGLDGGRFHIYESNPAPWWVGLVWIAFFGFGTFATVFGGWLLLLRRGAE